MQINMYVVSKKVAYSSRDVAFASFFHAHLAKTLTFLETQIAYGGNSENTGR